MKYSSPDIHPRMIVVAALMASSVFASAQAAQVEVINPDPNVGVGVFEDAGTVDIVFRLFNTGKPDTNSSVDIGTITELVTPLRSDTEFDVLAVGSIVENDCGILAAKKSCSVTARYDVIDKDPLDQQVFGDKGGVWFGGIRVPWTTERGISSDSVGLDAVLVGDAKGVGSFAIPEPSTWVGLLIGFSALGFAGRFRARSRQV
jgi:hypothetical protein